MQHIYSALIFIFSLLLFSCSQTGEQQPSGKAGAQLEKIDEHPPIPLLMYGINVDSMDMVCDRIRPNQVLSDLLLKYHIDYQTVINIAEASKEVFDVRRFMSGRPYTILMECDSVARATYLIYEINEVDYVVFDIAGDSIYTGQKPITIKQQMAAGTITSSLYETLDKQGVSNLLALSMADVYAWAIDFYHLQKGDSFKVIYNEKYVDGQRVGIKNIEAAIFQHEGNDFYAFWFEQDTVADYFDEEGSSLRKAFLKSPLEFGRISSPYNPNRLHPILKVRKPHLGTDYAAPTGTPILAVGDGVISEARYKRNNGNYVKIRHNSTYSTQYLHMSRIGKGIKPGVKVKQGDVIGYVGSTGLATGPHVCFRFWKNGSQINHQKIKMPPSKPVPPAYRDAFEERKAELLDQLKGAEGMALSTL